MSEKSLPNATLYLMSIAAGLVVANLYYNQPLLNQIAETFGVGERAVANVPLSTQLGYAAGLLFIMPLADKINNMKILIVDFILMIFSLLIAAFATSLNTLIVASFFIGLTSVVPQLFVPLAASLSSDADRGRAIGIVMSGLLIGIIGSRVISGFIGAAFGWETMYYVATGIMVLLLPFLYVKLPSLTPSYKGSYKDLMQSIWHYTKSIPELQMAALMGALSFAGLSAFWTNLTFLLKDNFDYGSDVVGLFGILGIVGALAAARVGKLNQKVSNHHLLLYSTLIMLLSWLVLGVSGKYLIGLAIGTVLIDLGKQALHITNQNIIFAKYPEARNRMNTVYMVSFFIGGALGTSLSAWMYELYAWWGVVAFGFIVALLILLLEWKRNK